MTPQEYDAYKQTVERFFVVEEIDNFSFKDDEAESYFSHSPCDCCNRPLGGARYDVIAAHRDYVDYMDAPPVVEIYEYSVCVDCVYFEEYGQLDDMTMLELEQYEQMHFDLDGAPRF